jgi:hypothetical protein
MFAGHVGAAMAIGRAERRVNLGVLVFAAMFLDFVLWVLVLLGWESVTIPANFKATHQPEYVFPYSHGLVASIGWSALAGIATFLWYPRLDQPRLRAAALVSAAVFSHWLLDALVHAPELPVAGAASTKVGRLANHAGRAHDRSVHGAGRSLPLRVRRKSVTGKTAVAFGAVASHGRCHRGRNDGRAASTVGPRHGGELARHHRLGERICGLAR